MTTQGGRHKVEHEIAITAPAVEVYRLLADVENWPLIFPPTVYVDREECSPSEERIRIWATANGEAKNWSSRRTLDAGALRIDFRQEISSPPVAAMGGTWLIEPTSTDACRVRLSHDYRAIGDEAKSLAWISEAVDRNSRSELESLKANAELARDTAAGLPLSFDDTVRVNGAAKDVYDFLNEAQRWQERLPHVARVSLEETMPGLQILEMDTVTKDGSTHTTKSVRVCFPHTRIVYKQITLPALLTLHTGHWQINEDDDGVSVTSRHTVVINTDTICRILGAEADIAQAREFVRTALTGNSRATMELAREYAGGRQ